MPTATTTTTIQPKPRSLKPAGPLATLQSLYNRAARAFLLREIPLVHALLESAFALLQPPEQFHQPDDFASHRSKWDLLRITLETTVFTTPPSKDLPDALRELLTQTPHSLLIAAYRRSLDLFTPPQCPSKGTLHPLRRHLDTDWLATRAYSASPASIDSDEEQGNYRKVVEAYCLHVLPKLEQWDYAKEFLDYESELTHDARQSIKHALQDLHAQAISARLPPPAPSPSPPSTSPRPYSPTPSSSSSSSSLSSTASMHTVVPATPRARSALKTETYRRASSSPASTHTVTPRQRTTALPTASPPRVQQQHHLPRIHNPGPLRAVQPPSTFALIKASIAPYLTSTTRLSVVSIATFVLLLVLPLFLRRRAARRQPDPPGGNAELVRRRLLAASAASGGGAGLLGRVLAATIRVVGDTIRMGGSGLV
ncbi:hypothetical protein HMN09_01023500 [Mycena chlorophos]|uniref:Uncharacterized protein n=1 Tax=Mycena chlorophos TaxID=658473 RepID=A0A8H6SEQ3_MYCCL|nr:hypothetical protein HMN09_01023500 [Mycena chlorophos]